ncbi:MAG TPA: hypothetical protein ACFCUC_05370 [Desulfobacterales bacterium]
MKIQPPFRWGPILPGQKAPVRSGGKGVDFTRTLQEAIGRGEPKPAAAPSANAAVFRPGEPGPVSLSERLDGLLDAVAGYRKKLGDTDYPAGELRPMLEALERQAEPLQAALDRLPPQHPLRQIVSETLVAISLEKARLDRGDYGA